MSFAPASIPWFAVHELRLAWRDTIAMLSGGKRGRLVRFAIFGALVYGVLHLIAWGTLRQWIAPGMESDKTTLVLVSGMIALFGAVTLSQAIESVTRVYYLRADLDLVLSSPASSRRLFAVRAGAVALTTFLLGALLVSPAVTTMVILSGPAWFSAYFVLIALAAGSVALALLTTLGLFTLVGPRRTRTIAQIVAAIIGAGFVIGIQAVAILSHEGLSRFAFFQSPEIIAAAPPPENALWLPARAVMGDLPAALILAVVALALLGAVIAITAPSYARLAISTAGLDQARGRRRSARIGLAARSQRQVLRAKEWKLLQRDPWLLSQTLMQMLYLVPPALLLWVNYGADAGSQIVVVPVLVMAAGQLAGGLAWLAISGEDAHDLVATAPLTPRLVLRAKVEAVLVVIAVVLAPILALLLLISWSMALVTGLFAALAAAAATAIQLWFRVTARRSMFRRRQVASRAATLCEAFASISLAATAALVAAGSPIAVIPGVAVLAVLGLARLISPRPVT